ncbi:MAG TPA: Ig-like domain-containing protein, partial [Verrucomicrobiota bacterium]|nr:Ig-like domain-containing protein [Verrucomicrobiota bacterium]
PDYPGQRAFYSLTGATNSWIPIPEFSSSSPISAKLVALVNLQQTWMQSNYLYIIWVDDNSSVPGSDPTYVIDNFKIVITGGTPVIPPVSVNIVSPTNNEFYISPNYVTISADATSRGGTITNVVFYVDENAIGQTTQFPFSYNWQNPQVGLHSIYAEAYDDKGNSSTSRVVQVLVFDRDGTPMVKIVNPTNGYSVEGPINLPILASAVSPFGISNVQFYANDLLIGQEDVEPYSIVWNTIFGNITLFAVANGSNGLSATSAVVNITVSEPPINTNPPVIVSIDPPAGATVQSLTQILITFSEPVINVDAKDLLINGKPAKEVNGSGTTYLFTFDSPPYGTVTISWAADNGITDIGYPTNLSFDSSNSVWNYRIADLTPPIVVRRIPSAGDLVYSSLNQITVIFSEPVIGVSASDLLINGLPATNLIGSLTTYTFNFESPTNQGLIQVSFSPNNHITDLAETPNAFNSEGVGAKWTYRFIISVQQGNDNFANRIEITDIPMTVIGYNGGATTENGEPLGSGFLRRGASVWWKWVAPYSGVARIDTFGSYFNTGLGVFTGASVNALTQVAYNDNAPNSSYGESLVTFNAVKGTEYQIQVCGVPNGFPPSIPTGTIYLNVSMPPTISMTSPTNNSTLHIGEATTFAANLTSNVAPIMQVDYYFGSTYFASAYIGTALNPPYSIIATNFPPGSNTVYAVATDILSQTATSSVNVVSLDYGVTIVSPVDGYVYSGSNITISAMTYLKEGSITNVEFYIDDNYIGSDAISPYSCAWSNMVGGSHRITAVGYDNSGKSYISKPVYIGCMFDIVSSQTLWRYLDNGSDQGTAWKEPDFDDSSWSVGLAPMGYSDANGQYPVTTNSYGPDPNNKYITTYYRTTFNVTNINQYSYLLMYVQRDDGIIVYLNGKEVYRNNMPGGTITYTNYASSSVGGSDENANYIAVLDLSLLNEGRNVIAAEVHQSDASSSDIWFYLRLVAYPEIIRNQFPQVALTSPTNNSIYVAPDVIEFRAEASDTDGWVVRVEFYDGETLLGETTEAPYAFSWTNPAAGWHNVRTAAIDDMGAKQFSETASVIVFESVNKPLVEITSPANGRVFDNLEGYTNITINIRAAAFNAVSNVIISSDGVKIGSLFQEPYSFVWTNVPFGSHTLVATVYDVDGNSAVSLPVNLTVVEPPINNEAPKIASVDPVQGSTISNLTTIKVIFTERVFGVDASDLLVNGQPALNVTGSGSNYVFTVNQPPYGTVVIFWSSNHGITDKGYPDNLPFDATAPDATWVYNLIDKVAPYIVSRSPEPNASVTNLTQIRITFSEKMNGVDASDLLINNVSATDVSTTDDITYIFTFSRPLYGTVNISWAQNHNITDRSVEPNAFVPTGNSANWQYILVAPIITIVPRDAYYLIHKGLFEPSTPLSQWRLLSYEDTLWKTNQAPFYYDIDKTPVAF